MDRNSFFIGLFVGLVIYFMFTKLSSPQVSEYTIQPFEGMTDREAVKASVGTQTAAIVAEMMSALATAKNENKTVDERVAISNTYTDQLCQLNKAFAEWSLRHSA
jgi:hypothetical protein